MKIFLLILILALNVLGQTAENKSDALTNQDVIEMVKAGLPESVILTKIKASKTSFKSDLESLKALKEANVSENIVSAMIVKQTEEDSKSQKTQPDKTKTYNYLDGNEEPLWVSTTGNVFKISLDGDNLAYEYVGRFKRYFDYRTQGKGVKQDDKYVGSTKIAMWYWYKIDPATGNREIDRACVQDLAFELKFVTPERAEIKIEDFPDGTTFDESCKPSKKKKMDNRPTTWEKTEAKDVIAKQTTILKKSPNDIVFYNTYKTPRTLSKEEEKIRYKSPAQILIDAPKEVVAPILMRGFQSWEYQVEEESQNRIILGKQVSGLGNKILAGLIVGNGGESRYKIQISFSELDGKTNVIVNLMLLSQNVFGKNNSASMDGNDDFRRELDNLLEQIRVYAEERKPR